MVLSINFRSDTDFRETLKMLESDPKCHKLNLKSFLDLPRQRITRLPLLMYGIHQQLEKLKDYDSSIAVRKCLSTLKTVIDYK